jgi:guanylate kinase
VQPLASPVHRMAAKTLGRLVVISGPSGAGKTSVCKALKRDPRVEFSVSATTRRMRAGEVDGVDYHFLSPEDFQAREARGEFLESASYNGRHYGTLRAPMERALTAGKVFVLEIEVQGTRQLRDRKVEGTYIFVVPPDMAELRRRLTARGQNSLEEIENRMRIAAAELEASDLYDHVVENHRLEDTIARVRALCGLEES